MVVTGRPQSQVDLPQRRAFGAGGCGTPPQDDVPDISFNYFTAKDVVRHPLVAAIIEAYEADGGIRRDFQAPAAALEWLS